jgi:hypothetical protein
MWLTIVVCVLSIVLALPGLTSATSQLLVVTKAAPLDNVSLTPQL